MLGMPASSDFASVPFRQHHLPCQVGSIFVENPHKSGETEYQTVWHCRDLALLTIWTELGWYKESNLFHPNSDNENDFPGLEPH